MSLGTNSKMRDATIGGVLFTALLVLAVLQYRWIGQVSEVDGDRLRQGLRASVTRFSDDFNGEIERLVQVIVRGSNPALWSELSEHSAILKRAWATDATDLPEYLKTFAGRLPSTIGEFRPGRGGGGRSFLMIENTIPALAIPNIQELQPTGPIHWTILELDKTYIDRTWIPALIAKDFGEDYDVHVGPHLDRTQESESAPLFSLRQGGFGRGGKGGPPPDFNGRGKQDGPPPDFGNKQGKRPPFGEGGDPGWRVSATYRSGTMSQMVENLRLRNLAVSFGILLLMGISVGMLIRSTGRANALAQQQMEFVAGVTHELRTPLAVIQSASQNLADGVATGEAQAKRYGGVIHEHSKRLGNMVEQVLRFAGLSSQHGELQRGPVEVAALIDEAIADCRNELAVAGSAVEQSIEPSVPAIDGDRGALLHCLRNLLTNAAKHGGGSPVELSAHSVGSMIEIRVEDHGPGIEAADLPYVFEPFYRGQRAKDDQVQGSGLGLSLVKKIVEAHGGSVSVSSSNGAKFRLLLPAVRA
ncbi:MAG: HAMP domain-containing sensor histidine kinase [Bryobacteraceae bacterium]